MQRYIFFWNETVLCPLSKKICIFAEVKEEKREAKGKMGMLIISISTYQDNNI